MPNTVSRSLQKASCGLNLFLVAVYPRAGSKTLSDGFPCGFVKDGDPADIVVLVTSCNLHLNLGVLKLPEGRTLTDIDSFWDQW